MNSLTQTVTPEALYGDATAKARAYEVLSHRYAAEGKTLLAIHAAWAADINLVQAVMWERVMIASPRPDEQFFAVATTVSRALAAYAVAARPSADAREAVLAARGSLGLAFDDGALRILHEKFIGLDHLLGLPHPAAGDGERLAHSRIGEETAAGLAATRRQAAEDCMAVARRMNEQGEADEALTQAWQSDWNALEAYLLDAATAVGDTHLITVELRWALACDAVSRVPALPSDFCAAVNVIRERITAALGPIEGARLSEHFAPPA